MSKPEPVPEFRPAPLVPTVAAWECPSCGHTGDVELSEDDSGFWSVLDADRYIQCPECETNIDIGWNGWCWLAPIRKEIMGGGNG
jgi:rubredoxin